MKGTRMHILAGAIALACAGAACAGSYGNAYFFGDSLTDAGAFTNLVGPNANRFVNNPGTVWAENLGARYGIAVRPGYALDATMQFVATGGNDYAIGGARVASGPGYFPPSAAIAANIVPVAGQVATHLGQNGGGANPSALYGVWIGANDVFHQADQVGLGAITPTQAAGNIAVAATAAVGQVAGLRAAGARHIVVLGLPDVGATPFGAVDPAHVGAALTQLSGHYNNVLTQGLVAAGITDILYLDPRPLMADIQARPAAWGITNTGIPACGAISSLGCGPAQQIPGSGNFLFADIVHPSAYTHGIIGDWVYDTLEAPGRMAAMGVVALMGMDAQWRPLDERLRSRQTGATAAGHHMFASIDHGSADFRTTTAQAGFSGDGQGVTVGLEVGSAAGMAGVAVGIARHGHDLKDSAGRIDHHQITLSGFGALALGGVHLDGVASVSMLDFDTRRTFRAISSNGSADGTQWGVKVGAAYPIRAGGMTHGPLAALIWQRAEIDGFTENGIAALSFTRQERVSQRHRLGWQAAWDLGRFSPYARLTHEKEYKDNQGTIGVGMADTPFSYAVPVRGATAGYGLLAVGTGMRFGGVTANVGLSTALGQSDRREWSLTGGITLPF